jgi:hypothetical protein
MRFAVVSFVLHSRVSTHVDDASLSLPTPQRSQAPVLQGAHGDAPDRAQQERRPLPVPPGEAPFLRPLKGNVGGFGRSVPEVVAITMLSTHAGADVITRHACVCGAGALAPLNLHPSSLLI